MFGSRKGGAILFALVFATIGTTLILLSHARPYVPPKITLIVNGVRIDGTVNDPSKQEAQYNNLSTANTTLTFRTLEPGQSTTPGTPDYNFLLDRWTHLSKMPAGTTALPKFWLTIGASDNLRTYHKPLITPFNEAALDAANANNTAGFQGLYLHEIMGSFFYNYTFNADGTTTVTPSQYNVNGKYDWWGVLKDPAFQDTLNTISSYVNWARNNNKKIIWSEPSFGWSYMNSPNNPNSPSDPYYNPAYNKFSDWGSVVIPMFPDNQGWQSEKSAAMLGALWDGRVHSNNVFGESVQGWQFSDPNNRKDLMYDVKVPSNKLIPSTFNYKSSGAYNLTQNASMCANISNTLRDTTKPLVNGQYPLYPLPGVLADAQTVATCTYNSMNYAFSNTATVFQLEGADSDMNMYSGGGAPNTPSPFMQGALNFINDLPGNTSKIILPIAGTCSVDSKGNYSGCTTPATVNTSSSGISTVSNYTSQTISATTWPNFTNPIATASSTNAGPPAAGWTAWNPLGNNTSTPPTAVSWGSGRIDLFTAGADNAVWHKWYANNAWNPGTTPYWESQGGASTVQGQAVSTWGANHLDVFEVRTSPANTVYQKTYDNVWGSWQPIIGLPGTLTIVGKPSAVSWGQGRIDLFVRASDNALWHNWYQSGWHSWESLGGTLASAPSAASWGYGHLDVFVRDTTNGISHKWYSPYYGWSAWASIGMAQSGTTTYPAYTAPAAVTSGYGHVFVFYADTSGHIEYKSFDLSTGWAAGNSGWTYMGGSTSYAPAVASWSQGRLDVFETANVDNRVYGASIQLTLPTYTPPPDADNDGVLDANDRCPTQFGPASTQGCPDSDSDGIADIDDHCPTTWGYTTNYGCPVHPLKLYHYYNPVNYDSFYTITRNDAGYGYYGYGFASCEIGVWDGPAPSMVPLWRYWNSTGGDHFYTIDRNDAGYAYYGYGFEGQEGWVYPPNTSYSLKNIFRYFAGGWIVDHYYGIDPYWSYPNYNFERVEAQGWSNLGGSC